MIDIADGDEDEKECCIDFFAAQIVFLAEQMSGSAFFEHPVRQKTQCCNVCAWTIFTGV